MKVIIVGAGLGGLSTAIALRKYVQPNSNEPLEIKVYDTSTRDDVARDGSGRPLRNMGAALVVQTNGLRVLKDFDPKLGDKVYATGYPCKHYTWKTSGNILLGRDYQDILPISRPLLIDCLQECLPDDIVTLKTVSKVITRQGQKPIIQFEDGSPDETADLVIGADGIRSVVRHDIFGERAKDKYHPIYLGRCAVGGVLDVPMPQHLIDEPSVIFQLGSAGIFGYCGLTSSTNNLIYFSFWDTDVPERGLKMDHKFHDLITKQLRERHKDWTDPLISKCLEKAQLDNIYPIFIMPDLPHWGRDGCVLVGDAAHALTPKTGQGSSQAFEDAQTLALLLAGYLEQHSTHEAVSRSISGLYDLRFERVKSLQDKALRMPEPQLPMSWMMTCVMYAVFFLLMKVQNIASFFGSDPRTWDAKDEVKKYLAR